MKKLLVPVHRLLQGIAKKAGYSLVAQKLPKPGSSYEQVLPKATYAPWLSDANFKECYSTIKNYTLVDTYRCYELWQLVEQAAALEGAIIEVGAWRGGSSALLAKKAQLMGIHDTVYICDTFTGVAKAGAKDTKYKGGEHADTSVETVQEVLSAVDAAENAKILVGMFPEESADQVEDETFRLCHVDVDVYQSAKDVVEWVWPKLVVGGIVVFDDYGFYACEGVARYINEERSKKDRLIFHNLNGHAIMVKLA